MVSFYALALVVVAVLLFLTFATFRFGRGLLAKAGFFCLIAAFLILKAILPRRDGFEAPGPLLTLDKQPELFAEIRDLSIRTHQEQPAEVYLIPDANAWVAQRGGFMGIGSRRVMGLGLPLLQVLTIPELRGVLAHEFGHFHGGDVAIGPWIHRTRSALVRTVIDLQSHSEMLSQLFIWYGSLFFRVSFAVSRHQEVLADKLAASTVGKETFASGLRAVNSTGFVFATYWQANVAPVVSAGFAPPLAAGFEAFLKTPEVAGKLADALKHQELHEKPSQYDTHPVLGERLAALDVSRSNDARIEGPPSLCLLRDLPLLEVALVDAMIEGKLKTAPLSWDEVGSKVWLPMWRGYARRFDRLLSGVTPSSLPQTNWDGIGRSFLRDSKGDPRQAADFVVGSALAVVLARAGFSVECQPGLHHALVGLGERIEVFTLREWFAKDPESAVSWRRLCDKAGITDIDLGTACAQLDKSEGKA